MNRSIAVSFIYAVGIFLILNAEKPGVVLALTSMGIELIFILVTYLILVALDEKLTKTNHFSMVLIGSMPMLIFGFWFLRYTGIISLELSDLTGRAFYDFMVLNKGVLLWIAAASILSIVFDLFTAKRGNVLETKRSRLIQSMVAVYLLSILTMLTLTFIDEYSVTFLVILILSLRVIAEWASHLLFGEK